MTLMNADSNQAVDNNMGRLKKKKVRSRGLTRCLFLLGVMLVLSIFFSFTAPGFLSLNTFMNVIKQNASLAILSLGITFIIMLAGTDLSSGANIAFAGACGALVMQLMGGQGVAAAVVGILATCAGGALIGAINGLLIGRYTISAFMVTLATMSLARGMALFMTNSRRVVVDNDIFNWIGQGKVLSLFNGTVTVPASVILLVVLFLIMQYVLTRTTFGRKTAAVGGNPVASLAAGINVKRHSVFVYIIGGLFAGFAAIVTVGRAKSAQPLAGINMEFDAITAVVIGGTSLAGGVASLIGSVLGAFLIGLIFSGLGMMQISSDFTYIVKGALIIFAVWLDQYADKLSLKARNVKVDDKKGKPSEKTSHDKSEKHFAAIRESNPSTLTLDGIVKVFPGVRALDGVNLTVRRGYVHALMGENGAGKSTLMKVLSGVYKKDGGQILVDGKTVDIRTPMDSEKLGISVIYQEFALVSELSIMQNIFLGKEIKRFGLLNIKEMRKRAQKLMKRFGLNVNVNARICDCTVGQQQMVEIAKAVDSNAWVIVMDEPTSAITETEKEKLFEIIRDLKSQGIAIIYISHRMSEIFEIADEITVLRDGKFVMYSPISEVDEARIITSMVGRELYDVFNRVKAKRGDVVLEVKDLYKKGVFEPISFKVHAGEVLGFSGLMGAGRTEIARCIFGLDKPDGGEIWLNGKKLNLRNAADGIQEGIGYVSEDRRREGIISMMSLRENITLPLLPNISRIGKIDMAKEKEIANEYIKRLTIKCSTYEQAIGELSGGNQQKACLAKWLCMNPSLLILDEPTRGIDIGAKAEIHRLIEELCRNNIAVIMISSELPEILGSSDRILVLYEGKMTRLFEKTDGVTQEMIMTAASGRQEAST